MERHFNRLVVKLGTSSLTHATGKVDIRHVSQLVRVLSDIANSGVQIALVSSGAIAVGVGKLGLKQRPKDTPGRQAAAAVGQCELMFMYDKLFSEYGHTVGQMLLTKQDVDDPKRHFNLVNSFEKLFEMGTIPIVNENDCVAVEEIVYGDNDCLSAVVATLIKADRLIILSDIDGLYSADPSKDPAAELIREVRKIDDNIISLAGGAGSERGTGGMVTKIHAAQIAAEAGIDTVVMNSSPADRLYDAAEGKSTGTLFIAGGEDR